MAKTKYLGTIVNGCEVIGKVPNQSKVYLRCLDCGAEFERNHGCIQGGSVKCKCKTKPKPQPRKINMIEYNGHVKSAKEWAEEFGVHSGTILSRYRKGQDISERKNERKLRTCRACGLEFMPKRNTQMYCCTACAGADIRKHDYSDKVCPICGIVFEVSSRQPEKIYCSVECGHKGLSLAAQKRREEHREERAEEIESKKKIKQMLSDLKKEISGINKKHDYLLKLENSVRECRTCGSAFLSKWNSLYCSDECKRKYNNRANDRRIYRNGKPDLSISLEKLYKRDNGMCASCGIECNWYDIDVRLDGVMIAGDTYPSIDHVIPLAKGGKHEWDNVQLMCRRCNYKKSDSIE